MFGSFVFLPGAIIVQYYFWKKSNNTRHEQDATKGNQTRPNTKLYSNVKRATHANGARKENTGDYPSPDIKSMLIVKLKDFLGFKEARGKPGYSHKHPRQCCQIAANKKEHTTHPQGEQRRSPKTSVGQSIHFLYRKRIASSTVRTIV